jgi:hypothetical protein
MKPDKEQIRYRGNGLKAELREYRKSKRQEEREALRKVVMGEIDEDEIDVYEEKKAIVEDWQ